MLRYKFTLAVLTLVLATIAVYSPLLVLAVVGGLVFLWLLWHFPLLGLSLALLSTLTGELVRLPLGEFQLGLPDLIIPTVILVWLGRKFITQTTLKISRSGFWLLLFLLATVFSLFWSSGVLGQDELLKAVLYFLRFASVASLFFVAQDMPTKSTETITNVFLVTIVLYAVGGFVLLHFIPDFAAAGLTEAGWDPHIGRLTGTWLDPNFAGGGLALGLALIGSRSLTEKVFWKKTLLLTAAALLLLALLLTYSRSGLLAFGVAILALGFLRSRTLLVAGLVLALLGTVASTRLQERLGEFANSISSLNSASLKVLDPTAALRVASWREGIRIYSEHPTFGVGFGAYAAHQRFAERESHAATGSDASLLTIAATTGTVGLTAFLGFLASLFVTALGKRKSAIPAGFLAGGVGLLAHAVFVNSLLFLPLAIYFFTLGGLTENHPQNS